MNYIYAYSVRFSATPFFKLFVNTLPIKIKIKICNDENYF